MHGGQLFRNFRMTTLICHNRLYEVGNMMTQEAKLHVARLSDLQSEGRNIHRTKTPPYVHRLICTYATSRTILLCASKCLTDPHPNSKWAAWAGGRFGAVDK